MNKRIKVFIKKFGIWAFIWDTILFPVLLIGNTIRMVGVIVMCVFFVMTGRKNEARKLWREEEI
jgi:hypothetical protein